MRARRIVAILAALVVAGLGYDLVFADSSLTLDYDYPETSNDVEVGIEVDDALAIAIDKTECINEIKVNSLSSCSNRVAGVSNDSQGFTISVSDKDNETALTKENSSATIPAIDGELTAGSSGWNLSGGLLNYNAIKSSELSVLKTSDVGESETTITYNFATGAMQERGSYRDEIVYTISNNEQGTYEIAYDANGGTVEKDSETASYGDEVTLPTPAKEGLTFAGWRSGSSLYFRTTNPNPENYYRVGLKAEYKKTIFNISTMQEMTPQICKNTTTPQKTAVEFDTDGSYYGDTNYVPSVVLTDSRDGSKYTIRKLADGNCWMVGELTYKITKGEKILTQEGHYYTPENSTQTELGVQWAEGDFTMHSYTDGVNYYYNHYAALASDMTNAQDSLCPTNWELPAPSSNSNKNLAYLLRSGYGLNYSRIDDVLNSPVFNIALHGKYYWYNGTIENQSTSYIIFQKAKSYHFELSTSFGEFTSRSTDSRYNGYQIRCVAK